MSLFVWASYICSPLCLNFFLFNIFGTCSGNLDLLSDNLWLKWFCLMLGWQPFLVLTKMSKLFVYVTRFQQLHQSLYEQLICHNLYNIKQNNSISFSYCYLKHQTFSPFNKTRVKDNKYSLYHWVLYLNHCREEGWRWVRKPDYSWLVLEQCFALFIGNKHFYSSNQLLFHSLVGKDTNCHYFLLSGYVADH